MANLMKSLIENLNRNVGIDVSGKPWSLCRNCDRRFLDEDAKEIEGLVACPICDSTKITKGQD